MELLNEALGPSELGQGLFEPPDGLAVRPQNSSADQRLEMDLTFGHPAPPEIQLSKPFRNRSCQDVKGVASASIATSMSTPMSVILFQGIRKGSSGSRRAAIAVM